jgi:Ca-activated chloride channel family protein
MTSLWEAALERFGVQGLAHPLGGVLAGLLALLAWWAMARARPASFEWSGVAEARRAGARRFDWLRGVSLGLRLGALLALALLFAGPEGVHRAPPEPGLGLDMTLVVDTSGSMRALDTQVAGTWRTRLDLARDVVARFAGQRAAEGDRIALVVFGESAFTQCPLTSDGAVLQAALERVEAGMAGEATALGQALALAVKRALAGGTGWTGAPEPGRVVVLLTDGRHNAGAISVEVATELASSSGVRVHTVAIGSQGNAPVPVEGRGGVLHLERHDLDAPTLTRIAEATGGRFFRARRGRDLSAVYAEIDALERAPRARPARVRKVGRPEPFLALAGIFLLGELTLARVLFRRLP